MNDDAQLIAVTRIAKENDRYVLRGMQVLPALRGQQIGAALLRFTIENMPATCFPCYCLAHDHLSPFYATVGFKPISASEHQSAPIAFLLNRRASYLHKGLRIELLCCTSRRS